MNLRPYQQECLDKILWERKANLEGNSLCILPTGAGKSVVIAKLVHELNEPVLILQPSKEILEQNFEKLSRYVDRSEIGIYSASMDEKTINHFTFATIGSVYKKPEFFSHFKLVIIDEAHLVNPKSLNGMFTSFLREIGNPKVIGFTATPYRIDHNFIDIGERYSKSVAVVKLINRMRGNFWKRILYNINIQDLINWNYLCPLEYFDKSFIDHKDIPTNRSQSDFDLTKYEDMMKEYGPEILKTITYAQEVSKSVLVFCSSVEQATELANATNNAEVVSSETNRKERDRIINGFKDGSIQTVFNVGVLTTGFDHPALDCIVLLRPTRSIGLYYQMLGRGVRISPGKTTCKVIDLTSTVKNIGRVETIKLVSGKESESGKYELITETGNWHNKTLYEFVQQVWGKKKKIIDNNLDTPF